MRRFLLLITTLLLLSNALTAQTISISPNAITGCPSLTNQITLGTITINEGGNGNFVTDTGTTQEITLRLPAGGFIFVAGTGVVAITNGTPDITLNSTSVTLGNAGRDATIKINNKNSGNNITTTTTDIITITGLRIIAPITINNGEIEAVNPDGTSFAALDGDKFGDIDITTPTVTIASPVCGNTVSVKASPAGGTNYVFKRTRGGNTVTVQSGASDTWVATVSGDAGNTANNIIVEDDEIEVEATIGGCTGTETKVFDEDELFLVTFDAGTGTVLKNPKDPFDISTGDSPALLSVTGVNPYLGQTPAAFNCTNCNGVTPDPCLDPCPNPACPDCPPPPDCSDPCANPADCICNITCRDLPEEQRPICQLRMMITHAIMEEARNHSANLKRLRNLANRNTINAGPLGVRYDNILGWVFDPAGLAPGDYFVEYSGNTGDVNSPCNANEDRKITFKVTVFEDKQLVGIINSGVCKETATDVRIGWLGQTPGLRELISISDDSGNNLITGTLIPNYRRGINSGFVISKSALATTSVTSFRAKIDYRQSNGSGGFTNLTAYETVIIVPSPTIEIRTLGGSNLANSYCLDAQAIDLSGYVRASSGAFIQADVASSSFYIYNNDNSIPSNNLGSPINAKLYFELGGDLPPTVPPNNPNVLRLNTNGYTLSYIYVNDYGCRDTIQQVIGVNPLPTAVSSTPLQFNFCIGESITNLIVPGFDVTNTGRRLKWYSSTGIELAEVTNNVGFPSGVRNEFANSEEFQVAELSASGCIGDRVLVTVNVGTPPKANFEVGSTCVGDKIRFLDKSTPDPNATGVPPLDRIVLYEWDFGNGTASGDTLRHPESPSYMVAGVYNVKLKITTGSGCTDSITKKVVVHRNAQLVDGVYNEDFDNTDTTQITWTSSRWTEPNGISSKSSWKFIPITRADGTTSRAFATNNTSNTYNNSEYSWIESPCFDLDTLKAPLINIKLRYDTDFKSDGTFVIYTLDNGNKWYRLGTLNEGSEWYNSSDILGFSSIIEGSNTTRIGWSGKSNDFIDAKLSLQSIKDSLVLRPPHTPVRFRIVFGSNGDNPNSSFTGVAIDQVVILDKNHKVLLEHFTNKSLQDTNWNTFASSNSSKSDLVHVQYHTTFPTGDALGQDSRPESNARSLHYAVAQPPYTVVDGRMEAGKKLYEKWDIEARNYYAQRSLLAAPFIIGEPVFTEGTSGNPLKISLTVARTAVKLEKTNAVVAHMMIVENDVDGNKNVVRRMLPSPGGTRIENFLTATSNTSHTLQGSWKPRSSAPSGTYSLVVFIADEQTKEVYQAEIFPINQNVDARTAEKLVTMDAEDINLYPNPTSSDVTVVLPETPSGKVTWRMFDALGREVEGGSGTTDNALFRVTTQHCNKGIYIIEITTSEWKVRKSVSVIK